MPLDGHVPDNVLGKLSQFGATQPSPCSGFVARPTTTCIGLAPCHSLTCFHHAVNDHDWDYLVYTRNIVRNKTTFRSFLEPAILNMIWPTLVMRWLMLSPGLMKEGHMVNQCSPVAAPPVQQSNGRGLPPAADLWRGQWSLVSPRLNRIGTTCRGYRQSRRFPAAERYACRMEGAARCLVGRTMAGWGGNHVLLAGGETIRGRSNVAGRYNLAHAGKMWH
jgi:hypothetical protein